jgi:AraC family transcriptional regulator
MGRPLYPPEHYASRIARALSHIERHLGQPVALATLAEQAAFSPYHFHRIFCDWQGETPQAYIRRQRLERSAALLHYGQGGQIAGIAQDCGFTSVQAFNRAFRAYFGTTPTAWRRGAYRHWQLGAAPDERLCSALQPDQVRVKNLAPVQTVYRRKLGPYLQDQEQLWAQFAAQTDALGLGQRVCFGLGLDDPAVTPAARCRYDLCMELPAAFAVPRHTPVKRIAGGQHAVLPYCGAVGQTLGHWLWLLQVWLPQSGFIVSQHVCFERYPDGIPTRGIVRSELCLPLARRVR